MTRISEIYKCDICGNIVEVLHTGAGELVCCGKPMRLCVANTVDASREKHVPIVEKTAGGLKVSVGSIPHPMEEKHYIEWIEIHADGKILRQFLKPGQAPAAQFEALACPPVPACPSSAREPDPGRPGSSARESAGQLTAFEYCNLHGLWKAS